MFYIKDKRMCIQIAKEDEDRIMLTRSVSEIWEGGNVIIADAVTAWSTNDLAHLSSPVCVGHHTLLPPSLALSLPYNIQYSKHQYSSMLRMYSNQSEKPYLSFRVSLVKLRNYYNLKRDRSTLTSVTRIPILYYLFTYAY